MAITFLPSVEFDFDRGRSELSQLIRVTQERRMSFETISETRSRNQAGLLPSGLELKTFEALKKGYCRPHLTLIGFWELGKLYFNRALKRTGGSRCCLHRLFRFSNK